MAESVKATRAVRHRNGGVDGRRAVVKDLLGRLPTDDPHSIDCMLVTTAAAHRPQVGTPAWRQASVAELTLLRAAVIVRAAGES
ncbi:hypothetical protein [Kibdelosporangium aridum]|uniref:hypothetical protein n=1 Tax=Kibdelosporangium aridum TaxID=2030 RepID=UPI0009FBB97E|nr:hypothetical protein [Kibdelosporangium aridum]